MTPNNISVANVLSCASSNIIVLYFVNRGSINNSLSSVHIVERTNKNKEDKNNVKNIKSVDSNGRDDHTYDENIYPFNNNDEKKNTKHIIYSSDNNIVLLDGKKQILFRGHFNKISNVIKSYNNEYILSCDKGLNSFIILWKINETSFLDRS